MNNRKIHILFIQGLSFVNVHVHLLSKYIGNRLSKARTRVVRCLVPLKNGVTRKSLHNVRKNKKIRQKYEIFFQKI